MDEMEHKTELKRARVMRAADVIPPFGEEVAHPNDGEVRTKPPRRAAVKQGGNGDEAKVPAAEDANSTGNRLQDAAEAPAMFIEIPTFDLAENILAEHRRTAARRRRAPRQSDSESFVSAEQVRPRLPDPEPSTHDLLELQEIVAEIVARDIKRLCRGPGNQLLVQ